MSDVWVKNGECKKKKKKRKKSNGYRDNKEERHLKEKYR